MLYLKTCILCEKEILTPEEIDFVHCRRMAKGIVFHKSCFDSVSGNFFNKWTVVNRRKRLLCSYCKKTITKTSIVDSLNFVDLVNVSWKRWDGNYAWDIVRTVLFHPECFLQVAGHNYCDLLNNDEEQIDSRTSKPKGVTIHYTKAIQIK